MEIKHGRDLLSNFAFLCFHSESNYEMIFFLLCFHLNGLEFGVADHMVFKSVVLSRAYTGHMIEIGVTLRLLPPSL